MNGGAEDTHVQVWKEGVLELLMEGWEGSALRSKWGCRGRKAPF